jgi:hypothetical protein
VVQACSKGWKKLGLAQTGEAELVEGHRGIGSAWDASQRCSDERASELGSSQVGN